MATFAGTPGDDDIDTGYNVLYGDDGNDRLSSDQSGLNLIDGGAGNDLLAIVFTNNLGFAQAYGGAGNDVVEGHLSADVLYGGEDDDLVVGALGQVEGQRFFAISQSGDDRLDGDGGRDAVYGLDGNDLVFGGDGNDDGSSITVVFGVTLASGLYGGDGNDVIDGGSGSDLIAGGAGIDMMIGGTGADRFLFEATTDAGKGALRDVIRDFFVSEGDRIDLSPIDAKPKVGDQSFKYIKANEFHDKPGEVRFDHGIVSVDVDGNGKAEFQIKLIGVDHLSRDDFIL